jgi:hypothetical protein
MKDACSENPPAQEHTFADRFLPGKNVFRRLRLVSAECGMNARFRAFRDRASFPACLHAIAAI